MWSFASGVVSSSSHCPHGFSPLGSTRGGSVGILPNQLLHLRNSTTSGGLGVECLQPSLEVLGKLCVSLSCMNSSSSVQVSGRTCHMAIQTFDSGSTMLDAGSLAFHSSLDVGRCSSAMSCCKRSWHGCLSRLGAQGSAISAFNPLAAQGFVWCRQGLSSSVCQAVVGVS